MHYAFNTSKMQDISSELVEVCARTHDLLQTVRCN